MAKEFHPDKNPAAGEKVKTFTTLMACGGGGGGGGGWLIYFTGILGFGFIFVVFADFFLN